MSVVATSASASWQDLVDIPRLTFWLDQIGIGAGAVSDIEPLQGGTQNVLLRFTRSGQAFVLRRPPHNPYADGSLTMRREARVLAGLAGSDVPHPRLVGAESSGSVLGAAFYVMEAVEGFCAIRGLPSPHRDEPAMGHAMGMSLIEGLAALSRVDYRSAGLADFGKPDGFLERQTGRWLNQLDSYGKFEGWTGRGDLPGVEKIATWLDRNRPASFHPGIMHGDFHMGNALFSNTGPDLRAIVDWELATIGDPMVDLGCLLATWADPDGRHPGCISVTPWNGFPTEDELVARYAERSGRDVAAVNWYVVLACFKLAILQEGTNARAAAGQADPAVAEWLHTTSINLFHRALSRL